MAQEPELNPYAWVFEGDGRAKVWALPEWEMPGKPLELRRATARRLPHRLDEIGGTYYSATGGTLWAAIAYARYKGYRVKVEALQLGGWEVTRLG